MSQPHFRQKLRDAFADRALMVLVGLVFSALFLGAIWVVNKSEVFGSGNGVLFLLLAVDFIYSRVKIRELEKKLKEASNR